MQSMRRKIGRVLRTLKLMPRRDPEPLRYDALVRIIRENGGKRIMEIGTRNGERAIRMIHEAQRHHGKDNVEYYGFDLWEELDDETHEKEFSKFAQPRSQVYETLRSTGASVRLFQGFSRDTLPDALPVLPKMDVVFIDGGHSIETIENDWQYSELLMDDSTVVVFDDYYSGDSGKREDIGCRALIDEGIDRSKFAVQVLPTTDTFKHDCGELRINLVKVRRRGQHSSVVISA